MHFNRTAVAIVAGIAVSTAGFASASVLQIDGGTIQYGESGVTCDADGVKANWGLETSDNTVRSVRVSGIDPDCAGADMFVKVDAVPGDAKKVTLTGAESQGVSFASVDPADINSVKVWIEG